MKSFLCIFILLLSNFSFSKEVEIAVASMMHNLENESSIVFGDHVRKGIYLSLIHNSKKLSKKGVEIKLKEYSYTSENKSILTVAKEIHKSNAIAVHGYDYSSHALLSQHIHKNTDLSVILPTATSDKILSDVSNYFQIAGTNKSQAKSIVSYLVRHKVKEVTIIKRPSCAYCVDLSNNLEAESKRQNISVDMITADTAAQVKSKGNKYILLPMYETEAIKFIKLLSKENNDKVYIGGDGWTSKGERYFKLLKNLKFKALCLAHWNSAKRDKSSKRFKGDYKRFFGSEASDVSALSYDSMSFIIEGILETKTLNRSKLKSSLQSKLTFKGITGNHEFKSNIKDGYVFLSWINEEFRVLNEN